MSRFLQVGFGSLRILGQRINELRRLGLLLWTDTGSAALQDLSRFVGKQAEQNETAESALAKEITEILADGKVDRAELDRLSKFPLALRNCANRSHEIGEEVKL